MNNELLAMLEYIEQERGISKEQVVKALEQAILSAYRKSAHPATDLNVKVNLRTGELKAWARLKVVEEFPTDDGGFRPHRGPDRAPDHLAAAPQGGKRPRA